MKGSKIGTATIIGSNDPVCVANLESVVSHAPLEAKKGPRFNTPVRITIISHRSRLCDVDNASGKAAIDGLVHSGILADDSPKFVKEVRYQQVKCKSKEDEVTYLLIEEA
jgi:hypothetical protein